MSALNDPCRPPLPDGWKVDEDWDEHDCFYDEDSGDEWCVHVYRVYGPDDVKGPGAHDEVEAVNAAIDAGLLPGQERWRWATEEEAAQERAEWMASATLAAHVRMTANRAIDAGQLVTSADVKPEAAPVVRVTEVVGVYQDHWEDGPTLTVVGRRSSLTVGDLVPEGVEGKRGRFVVRVEFLEEET